jgi:hypothetical protein
MNQLEFLYQSLVLLSTLGIFVLISLNKKSLSKNNGAPLIISQERSK